MPHGSDVNGRLFIDRSPELFAVLLQFLRTRQRPPESVFLKAGQAAFHHALCVHGSWGNTSAKPRRSLVLNYFAHGTRACMDGELMAGMPAVRAGEALGGKFHPVVMDTRRCDMSALPVASV